MQEDEVAQVGLVRVQVLLVVEPVDGVGGDARLTWKAILLAFRRGAVQSVNAEDFLLSARVHHGNPRGEIAQIFLLVRFSMSAHRVHVPNVAGPAQVSAERIVDLVQITIALLLDLVPASPDPGHISFLDEFEGAGEVIPVVVGVVGSHDVARQHDQVWTLRVQHCLNQSLRLQIVL